MTLSLFLNLFAHFTLQIFCSRQHFSLCSFYHKEVNWRLKWTLSGTIILSSAVPLTGMLIMMGGTMPVCLFFYHLNYLACPPQLVPFNGHGEPVFITNVLINNKGGTAYLITSSDHFQTLALLSHVLCAREKLCSLNGFKHKSSSIIMTQSVM